MHLCVRLVYIPVTLTRPTLDGLLTDRFRGLSDNVFVVTIVIVVVLLKTDVDLFSVTEVFEY